MKDMPSITEARSQIDAGLLTPLDLVEQCLARIAKWDGRVHAWVSVDETGARQEAERLVARANDAPRGRLFGIPIGIKDIIDIQGLPTQAGSPLRRTHVAKRDAPIVARLRRADAIILGKTVTTEWASFDPPPTRNPWNLNCTPAGSSSGSAAATALDMCLGAVGSQTGGSITRPASYCGVSGLKPTYGRLSAEGFVPLSMHMDHPGPIARRVSDLALMFAAMRDDADDLRGHWADVPPGDTNRSDAVRSTAPKLGLFEDFFISHATPGIREATRAAVDRLRSAGARVEVTPVPCSIPDVLVKHRRVMAVEAAMAHRHTFPWQRDQYGPQLSTLLDEGLRATTMDFAVALEGQREFREAMMMALAPFDAIVVPATTSTAPCDLSTTGDPSFNAPWSYCGLPTVCFPCGLATDGLPAGLQIVGRPYAEVALLETAAWCERALDFRDRPALCRE